MDNLLFQYVGLGSQQAVCAVGETGLKTLSTHETLSTHALDLKHKPCGLNEVQIRLDASNGFSVR